MSLDAAMDAAKRGMYVHPLDHPSLPKCVGVGREHDPDTCTERGKHPTTKWGIWATTDPEAIYAEWSGRTRNVGIACGKSGIIVIDEDKPGEFQRWAKDNGHIIPATYTVKTAHGRHWYFRAPEGVAIGNADGMFAGYAINVRGGPSRPGQFGGYVVGAGSTHQTGVVYTADNALDPAPMPQWLVDALTGADQPFTTASGPFELPERITSTITNGPPSRDEVLYKYACSLQARRVPKIEALASMQHVAFPRVEQPEGHPYPLSKALSKVEAAYAQFGDDYTGPGKTRSRDEAASRKVQLTPAAAIKPRPVWWTWDNRVPVGEITMTPGRGGVGKSTFHAWAIGHLTRGSLPGIHYGTPRACVIAAAEDSWERTIVPRLIVAGADMDMVYRVGVVTAGDLETTLSLPADCAALEVEIKRVGAVLLSVDPLISTVAGGLDTHKDREVREALQPLGQLADRTGCSVLGNAHFGKANGRDPLMLMMGSVAFGNVARAVLGFAADTDAEDNSCVISQVKNNLGRLDLPSLRYRIEAATIDTDEGIAEVGKLVMLGESDRSVHDILKDRGDGRGDNHDDDRDGAEEWLRELLAAGPVKAADVYRAADDAGLSKDKAKRAKKKIHAVAAKSGMGGPWYWALAEHEGDIEGSTKGAKGAGDEAPLPSTPSVLPSDWHLYAVEPEPLDYDEREEPA